MQNEVRGALQGARGGLSGVRGVLATLKGGVFFFLRKICRFHTPVSLLGRHLKVGDT